MLTGIGLRGHLDVIGGEQADDAIQLSLPPISVVLVQHIDQLTFGEAHLILVACLVVVHGDDLAN